MNNPGTPPPTERIKELDKMPRVTPIELMKPVILEYNDIWLKLQSAMGVSPKLLGPGPDYTDPKFLLLKFKTRLSTFYKRNPK